MVVPNATGLTSMMMNVSLFIKEKRQMSDTCHPTQIGKSMDIAAFLLWKREG
jgi:hypothetical protein